jgi:uncharacterized repeat protein (TIGR04138 family)
MLCNECNEREATIHLSQIVGDKISKRDLCGVCGKELVDPFENGRSFPFEAFGAGTTEMVLTRIAAADPRYTKDAYHFVRTALDKTQKKQFGGSQTMSPHVSGGQLLESLRELAVEKFGKNAKATLNGWGVFKCEDFGEIVFNLVEAKLLSKQDPDTKADFQGGYDFDAAFPS